MLKGAGILFGEVVVVAVRVMVEAAVGVMSSFEKRCFSVSEVEVGCLGVTFGLLEWEAVLFVAFESNVSGRENV